MPSFALILSFILTTVLLLSCGKQQPVVAVDPEVGRNCYEAQLALLPNGTQYEGIEESSGGSITIRVMTGVEVTTVECALNPDGTLQNSRQ